MTKRSIRILPILVAAGVSQPALCAGALEATALYRDVAHDCRTLDLASWRHPTRGVLERARVRIGKVELCNGGVYPVYTVRFDASPMLGVNDKFFTALYGKMAAANGKHSFALVDPGWGVIATVDMTGKTEAVVSYEEFETEAPR